MASAQTITRIRLPLSSAYLIQGERPILVDTGSPGDLPRLLAALNAKGISAEDLSLVIHTHGHGDHAGSTAALRPLTHAKFAIHPADQQMVRNGRNTLGEMTSLEARVITPFVNKPFPPAECDLILREESSLAPYGVAGSILFTPGHTSGSISISLDEGDVIAGDVLMGGTLGGAIQGHKPHWHYYVSSRSQVIASVRRILDLHPHQIHVGHGGPLAPVEIKKWLDGAIARDGSTRG